MRFNKKWCLPHWLIFQNFPVIPPCDRPSVRQYNGQRCEDDITQKYNRYYRDFSLAKFKKKREKN